MDVLPQLAAYFLRFRRALALPRGGLPTIATVARLLCHAGRMRDGTSPGDSKPRG